MEKVRYIKILKRLLKDLTCLRQFVSMVLYYGFEIGDKTRKVGEL